METTTLAIKKEHLFFKTHSSGCLLELNLQTLKNECDIIIYEYDIS